MADGPRRRHDDGPGGVGRLQEANAQAHVLGLKFQNIFDEDRQQEGDAAEEHGEQVQGDSGQYRFLFPDEADARHQVFKGDTFSGALGVERAARQADGGQHGEQPADGHQGQRRRHAHCPGDD